MNDPDNIQILHELIAALDRRLPHTERAGEAAIVAAADALKAQALRRIAELEHETLTAPR